MRISLFSKASSVLYFYSYAVSDAAQRKIQPFETRSRRMRHVDDISFYKKMHAMLPNAALAARKERLRSGDPLTVRELWNSKDKNFLAIDFEWSEKTPSICLEFGYAALRSGYVASYVWSILPLLRSNFFRSLGTWPAIPEENYRCV